MNDSKSFYISQISKSWHTKIIYSEKDSWFQVRKVTSVIVQIFKNIYKRHTFCNHDTNDGYLGWKEKNDENNLAKPDTTHLREGVDSHLEADAAAAAEADEQQQSRTRKSTNLDGSASWKWWFERNSIEFTLLLYPFLRGDTCAHANFRTRGFVQNKAIKTDTCHERN